MTGFNKISIFFSMWPLNMRIVSIPLLSDTGAAVIVILNALRLVKVKG